MKYLRWNKKRIFYTEDDLLDSIERNNGKTKCLISLYGFTEIFDASPDFNSIIVDKVLIEGKYDALKSIYEFLQKQNNETILLYDGRKYYLIILLNEELDWIDLEEEASQLRESINANCLHIDRYNINTDPEKLIIIPNTWNPSAKKYTIAFTNTFPTEEEITAKASEEK